MKYRFKDHATYVGACEQLADDLIDFATHSVELEVVIASIYVPKKVVKWLNMNGDRVDEHF